jgi:hypothetical protein
MRASLQVAALVVMVLGLTRAVRADIMTDYTITFDELWQSDVDNGDDIAASYFDGADFSAGFRVKNGAFQDQRALQVYDGVDYSRAGGGVGMSVPLNVSDWGEVTLSVNDAALSDLTLTSFLLCRSSRWSPDADDEQNWKMTAAIIVDGTETQLNWWTLSQHGAVAVVQVEPLPLKAGNSVTIRWNNPNMVAMDDIKFTVATVPEPATMISWLLGIGGVGLVAYRRNRLPRA